MKILKKVPKNIQISLYKLNMVLFESTFFKKRNSSIKILFLKCIFSTIISIFQKCTFPKKHFSKKVLFQKSTFSGKTFNSSKKSLN